MANGSDPFTKFFELGIIGRKGIAVGTCDVADGHDWLEVPD
jgi:hypothetical protein